MVIADPICHGAALLFQIDGWDYLWHDFDGPFAENVDVNVVIVVDYDCGFAVLGGFLL